MSWNALEGHSFPKLRVANFENFFDDSADGYEFVVRAVATSRMIEDMISSWCREVGMSWNALEGHSLPKLRVANFENFFDDSADGYEFVVRAVATSRMIEDMIFRAAESRYELECLGRTLVPKNESGQLREFLR